MPEKKSDPAAAKAAAPSPPVVLAPAGESGDPAVHKLLADLDSARRNNDDDLAAALVGQLAALGFRS